MDLTAFQLSNEAEEGRWFSMDEKTRVKVRSDDSENYQKILRNTIDAYPNFRKLPRNTQGRVMSKAVATGLLIEWEHLEENGNEIECTTEEKIRICENYPSFRRYVQELASSAGNFRDNVERD